MTKEQHDRIIEIQKRFGEIEKEKVTILAEAKDIEKREKLSDEDVKKVTELNEKLDTFAEERSKLQAELVGLRAMPEELKEIPKMEEKRKMNYIDKMTKREKAALIVGKQARNRAFNEEEKRALGTALTTTATTFVEATSEVDGVNNAGVFISTRMVLDLLREDGKISPILADIAMTSIKGLVDFPYRASRDTANSKAEGATGKDNQMEWAKLTGVKGYLQTIIPVTDEVMALADFDFGAYIIDQILQDINEDWVQELIYGIGESDHIKGITIGATAAVNSGYDDGEVIDALVAGIKLCKGKYRRGAKIYIAQDAADEIMFSVDDNGNFKYPMFNNSSGITSFGTIRMEVDENLKDGEFIIGNVAKYFKVNSLIPIRLETERQARKGITEYVASEFCASAPFPGAFIHGKKAE